MIEVIGVRFREEGKTYYFAPNGTVVTAGQDVIVETSRGVEYGLCVSPNENIEDALVVQPLRPLIRIANDADRRQWEENRKKEQEAFRICEGKIAEHGLDMKLVEVEYTLDGSKILFFFTSEGRVDFRELVKELASHFRTRIELRQIGVRDEARMLGGLGICGRPFCCATFMDEFVPVSIKMAKTQNLSLNPTKISGTCGRLMCCLKYEQDTYEYLIDNAVKVDSIVKTVDGRGTVIDVNLFTGMLKVRLEGDSNDGTVKSYKSGQVYVLRNGKKGPVAEEPVDFKPAEPVRESLPEPFDSVPEDDDDETPSWLKPRQPQTSNQPREKNDRQPNQNGNRRHKKPNQEKNGQVRANQERPERPAKEKPNTPKTGEAQAQPQNGEDRKPKQHTKFRKPRPQKSEGDQKKNGENPRNTEKKTEHKHHESRHGDHKPQEGRPVEKKPQDYPKGEQKSVGKHPNNHRRPHHRPKGDGKPNQE